MRRKPRRTRAWSSTRRTVSLFGMRFHLFAGGLEMNEGATCGEWGNFERAAQNFGAFTHSDEADADLAFGGAKTFAMYFQFTKRCGGLELQANHGYSGDR